MLVPSCLPALRKMTFAFSCRRRPAAPRKPQPVLAALAADVFAVTFICTGQRSYLAFPGSTAFAAKSDFAAGLAKKTMNALNHSTQGFMRGLRWFC
jgi:hypothetical protein